MHCTLISSSTLVCTHSSCCDVWGASTAVILLPSDTEYASNMEGERVTAGAKAGQREVSVDVRVDAGAQSFANAVAAPRACRTCAEGVTAGGSGE